MANSPIYNIRIKDPVTEGSKYVTGNIRFNVSGPRKQAVGYVSGFPDGGEINAVGERTTNLSYEFLRDEMLRILETEISNKYRVSVVLETYEPEKPEPQPEPVPEPTPVDPIIEPVVELEPEPDVTQTPTVTNVITPPATTTPRSVPEIKKPVYQLLSVSDKAIELDELSLIGDNNSNKNQKTEDVASIEYPLVKINEYIFSRSELTSVTIDCTDFLPKITVSVAMSSHIFVAKEMPKDGDIISIAIRNGTDLLKMIRNDYVITAVHSAPNLADTKSPSILTFYGELFIPGLKSQSNNFSFEGTSYYALQDFAKKYGLGFTSNEDDTDDKQIWLKANIPGDIFVKNVTDSAWRDNESFYKSWIDVYYNLNFININKQLISAESSVAIAALVTNVDKNFNYGADTSEQNTKQTVKILSNFSQFKTSPFYIRTWRPMNRSSTITFQVGTKMTCEMFEHNNKLYENEESQKYWAVPVEPTYDSDKTNKTILLRGRATYVPDANNTESRRANYAYTELYQKFPWLGVQYTISNPDDDNTLWDGNHHKNYKVAQVQNLMNNKELDKLNVHVEVVGNNFNIIRADKIPLALIRTDTLDNMAIDPESKFNDALDLFYSGWYLVKGFTLSWLGSNKQSILSNFTQEFILTRREWPTPIVVDPISKTVS